MMLTQYYGGFDEISHIINYETLYETVKIEEKIFIKLKLCAKHTNYKGRMKPHHLLKIHQRVNL